MKTIYKKDLVAELAKKEGITKVEAERRIDSVLDIIVGHLVNGEAGDKVKIANFFNFQVKELKEKQAKNPRTGELMTIPATKTVVVRMTKPLKEKLQGKR